MTSRLPASARAIARAITGELDDQSRHSDAAAHARTPVQLHGDASGLDAATVHRHAARGVSGSDRALPFHDLIQRSFGAEHDISGIRAFIGGPAADAAASIGANAYATGDRIAFASSPSLHTAAHEATHVVQQRAGVRLSDNIGRVGDAYERHADAVADRVVAGESATELLREHASLGAAGGTAVQRNPVAPAAHPRATAPATAPAQGAQGAHSTPAQMVHDLSLQVTRLRGFGSAEKSAHQQLITLRHGPQNRNTGSGLLGVANRVDNAMERAESEAVGATIEAAASAREHLTNAWHAVRSSQAHESRPAEDPHTGSAPLPEIGRWNMFFISLNSADQHIATFEQHPDNSALQQIHHVVEQAQQIYRTLTQEIQRYRDRIESGGATSIATLEGVIAACGVVATICTGGMAAAAGAGVVAGAAVAGGTAFGYTLATEGAGQASEVAHGLRGEVDGTEILGHSVEAGAVAFLGAVTAGVGGRLFTGAFRSVAGAALTRIGAGRAAAALASRGGEFIMDFIGGATIGPILNTAVHAVIRRMRGRRPTPSYGELCDSAVHEMFENVSVMNALTMALGHGIGRAAARSPSAHTGAEPNAHTGAEPNAHDGAERNAHDGAELDAHGGTRPVAQAGADPVAHGDTEPRAPLPEPPTAAEVTTGPTHAATLIDVAAAPTGVAPIAVPPTVRPPESPTGGGGRGRDTMIYGHPEDPAFGPNAPRTSDDGTLPYGHPDDLAFGPNAPRTADDGTLPYGHPDDLAFGPNAPRAADDGRASALNHSSSQTRRTQAMRPVTEAEVTPGAPNTVNAQPRDFSPVDAEAAGLRSVEYRGGGPQPTPAPRRPVAPAEPQAAPTLDQMPALQRAVWQAQHEVHMRAVGEHAANAALDVDDVVVGHRVHPELNVNVEVRALDLPYLRTDEPWTNLAGQQVHGSSRAGIAPVATPPTSAAFGPSPPTSADPIANRPVSSPDQVPLVNRAPISPDQVPMVNRPPTTDRPPATEPPVRLPGESSSAHDPNPELRRFIDDHVVAPGSAEALADLRTRYDALPPEHRARQTFDEFRIVEARERQQQSAVERYAALPAATRANMTFDQFRSVYAYTGTETYRPMNSALRNGEPPSGGAAQAIRNVDHALNSLPPVEAGSVVSRGVLIEPEHLERYTNALGGEIVEPSYTSTGRGPVPPPINMIGTPQRPISPTAVPTTFLITTHTGRDISGMSAKGLEGEILIPAGARFRVTRAERVPSSVPGGRERMVIHMDEVRD